MHSLDWAPECSNQLPQNILSSVLWRIVVCAVIMLMWNSTALQVVETIIVNTAYDPLRVDAWSAV